MVLRRAQHPLQRLPRKATRLLHEIGRLADEEKVGLYLVGGVVRDLLLRRRNSDLDLTVEGDGLAFSRFVSASYGAGLVLFERFATARLTLPDGVKVDIASTRRESYADPAALPEVLPAPLEADLVRRDFTINAMAIQLNAATWGRLHDPYGGQDDLKTQTIRVLHARSFVDDPTRIFRAIRFVQRFAFHLERSTNRLLREAAEGDVVARLSGPRLANEMFLLMKERHPERAIVELARLRLLRFLHPRLSYGRQARRLMAVLPRAISWWRRQCPKDPMDQSLVWLMALLADADSPTIAGVSERLQLSTLQAGTIEWAGAKTRQASKTISTGHVLRPSDVYRMLSNMPCEALVLVLCRALATGDRARVGRVTRRLARFLQRDRLVRIRMNGEELKRLGLQPGPHFKKILDRLRDERINGTIKTAAEERVLARRLVARQV